MQTFPNDYRIGTMRKISAYIILSIALIHTSSSVIAAEWRGQELGIVTKLDDSTRTITVNNTTYQIAPETVITSDSRKRIDPVALPLGTTVDIRWRDKNGIKVIEEIHIHTKGQDFTPPQ